MNFSFAFFPMHIGDYVVIEDDCVINAASIGSFVHIGKSSIHKLVQLQFEFSMDIFYLGKGSVIVMNIHRNICIRRE